MATPDPLVAQTGFFPWHDKVVFAVIVAGWHFPTALVAPHPLPGSSLPVLLRQPRAGAVQIIDIQDYMLASVRARSSISKWDAEEPATSPE
jgi:hypothetical protein